MHSNRHVPALKVSEACNEVMHGPLVTAWTLPTAAYKAVTRPEDWSLDGPMLAFRMRHADGLAELDAQMQYHFFAAPVLPQDQPQGQPQGQDAAKAWEAQPNEQKVAEVDAAEAHLVTAFDAAVAAGSPDPAAATAAAMAPGAPQQAQLQQLRSAGGKPADAQQRFEAFTYLSQLQQALAYQTAVHQWRRNKADPNAMVRVAAA
jgi:hypothetical protein